LSDATRKSSGRTRVVGILKKDVPILRSVGAVLLVQREYWQFER
jgi:hypothetical protein